MVGVGVVVVLGVVIGEIAEERSSQSGGAMGGWSVSPSRRMFGPEYSSDNAGDGPLTSEEQAILAALKDSAPGLYEAFMAFLKEWTPAGGASSAQVTPPQSPGSYAGAAQQASPPPAPQARGGKSEPVPQAAGQLPSPRELARRFAVWRGYRCTLQGLRMVMNYLDLEWTGGQQSLFRQWQLLSREATRTSVEAFGCVVQLLNQTRERGSMGGKTSQPPRTPPPPPPTSHPNSDEAAWEEEGVRTGKGGGGEESPIAGGGAGEAPSPPEESYSSMVDRLRAGQVVAADGARQRRARKAEEAKGSKGKTTKSTNGRQGKEPDARQTTPPKEAKVGHPSKGGKGLQAVSSGNRDAKRGLRLAMETAALIQVFDERSSMWSGAGAKRRLQRGRTTTARVQETEDKKQKFEEAQGLKKAVENQRKKGNQAKGKREQALVEAQEGEGAATGAQVRAESEVHFAGIEVGPPPGATDTLDQAHEGAESEGEVNEEASGLPAGEEMGEEGGEEFEGGEEAEGGKGREAETARAEGRLLEAVWVEEVSAVAEAKERLLHALHTSDDSAVSKEEVKRASANLKRAIRTVKTAGSAEAVRTAEGDAVETEEAQVMAPRAGEDMELLHAMHTSDNSAVSKEEVKQASANQKRAVRTPVSNEEVWKEVIRIRALKAEAQQATLRREEQRIAAEANAAAGALQAVQLEGGRGSAEDGMGEETAEEGGVEPGGSTGEGHRALEAARSTGLGVVVEEKEERREETAAPHEDQVEYEKGGGDGGGG